jgi:YgiT-type zinc finger domain-containing protein
MMQSCPECGFEMKFETRTDQVTKSNYVDILGWWCSNCGEAIFDWPALKARQRAVEWMKNDDNDV